MNANDSHQPTLPLPELPVLDSRLYAIHYSQELQANCPAQTPPVGAIIVQHVFTEQQHTFSAFHIAERLGIAPADFLTRLPELEKQLLEEFFGFVGKNTNAVWMHWAMRQARFGFEVLAQRARLHGLTPAEIPIGQRFDLSGYLKQRFGEDFAPHPRLLNAIKANGLGGLDLLDEQAAAAAWAGGQYTHLTVSLAVKVDAIADLFRRVCSGTFRTGAVVEVANGTGTVPTPPPVTGAGGQTSFGVKTGEPQPPADWKSPWYHGRVLCINGQEVLRFSGRRATCQEPILEALQLHNWRSPISVPEVEEYQLGDAVYQLNSRLKNTTLRIQRDGTGVAVTWRFLPIGAITS